MCTEGSCTVLSQMLFRYKDMSTSAAKCMKTARPVLSFVSCNYHYKCFHQWAKTKRDPSFYLR